MIHKNQKLLLFFATNAGLGYAPVASGTFGTLLGIPIYYLLAQLAPMPHACCWLAILLMALWSADGAGKIFTVVDDGRIVSDELIGYLTTVVFLPFSWPTALAAFLLFRFFDIVKLWPACWFDNKVKNGFGVVMDDVVAGIYAAGCLRLLMHLWPELF
ncbi:MAG: phosphatidylglycerophosphatase A [Desulfuromonas sp.]|nr:phosphatidylglycerophosphatase A [Desulfuromonas sp.]